MTTAAAPAKATLTFDDAVAAIGGKPSNGGWYNGCCPAHNDSSPSLGIKSRPDGTFAIKCQAGCKRHDVIAALEQKTGKQYGCEKNGKSSLPTGLTLSRYAEMKKLPTLFLHTFFRVIEGTYHGTDGVGFCYYDENGNFAGLKSRLSESSHDARWAGKTERTGLYGLATLAWLAKEIGWNLSRIVLCEGESDTQTLVYNGIPALGISGKSGWEREFANLPLLAAANEILVVRDEPDAEEFVQGVIASFPNGKARKLILPGGDEAKSDPSALWIASKTAEEFDAAWRNAIEGAYDCSIPFTDTGNAERLVKMHGQNFRWLTDATIFRMWDGQIWKGDDAGTILLPHTKEVVRAIADPEWRQTSESGHHRNQMISMSRGEREVLADSSLFDQHPMLLNVQNGTLDLATGNLRDFERDDFLTKRAKVAYDPFADCPKFDDFLSYIFDGDQDTIHFILKALGYTLTGKTDEQCFLICHGLGANGKTTLIEILMKMLGADFATPAKFTTFVVTKAIDSKYELAQFKGKRLVTTVEPRKAGHLDEEVLKQMTGGDMIRARDIYQKDVVYYPEFKLWMAMNNQPRIVGTDEGIWRRVRMIPFDVRIPEARKIKDFASILVAEEGPGILNKIVRGAIAWQDEGLQPCGAVKKATTEFRASQNVIERFFDTYTVTGRNDLHVRAGILFDAYRKWAERENQYAISWNEFADELKRRGFEKRRAHEGYEWWGIGLRA